jgi:hypothetical protein
MRFRASDSRDALSSEAESTLPTLSSTRSSGHGGGFFMFSQPPRGAPDTRPILNEEHFLSELSQQLEATTLEEPAGTLPLNQKKPSVYSSKPSNKENIGAHDELDPNLPELSDPEARRIRVARLEREKAALEASDREYVRLGGMLKDADGRRDVIRTERIRKELKEEAERLRIEKERRAEEDRRRGIIKVYETRWSQLLRSTLPDSQELNFSDIPWPLFERINTLETVEGFSNLPAQSIADFVFSPLREGNKSPKDLIRDAFLKWHPDKFESRVLKHVKPSDRDEVLRGARIVVDLLSKWMDVDTGKQVS